MGTWSEGPLGNDRAADWLGSLISGSGLRDHAVRALESDDPQVVRAAAWLVARLGVVYVWPIATLDADRQLAREALEKLLTDEDWLGSWVDRAKAEDAVRAQLAELG
jgi:hypothetical protein